MEKLFHCFCGLLVPGKKRRRLSSGKQSHSDSRCGEAKEEERRSDIEQEETFLLRRRVDDLERQFEASAQAADAEFEELRHQCDATAGAGARAWNDLLGLVRQATERISSLQADNDQLREQVRTIKSCALQLREFVLLLEQDLEPQVSDDPQELFTRYVAAQDHIANMRLGVEVLEVEISADIFKEGVSAPTFEIPANVFETEEKENDAQPASDQTCTQLGTTAAEQTQFFDMSGMDSDEERLPRGDELEHTGHDLQSPLAAGGGRATSRLSDWFEDEDTPPRNGHPRKASSCNGSPCKADKTSSSGVSPITGVSFTSLAVEAGG